MPNSTESSEPSYRFKIVPKALNEWNKLNKSIKDQLTKKLNSIQLNPIIPKNRLHGLKGCYKIKLKRAGYRLVYQVVEDEIIIVIWAIDKREDSKVYDSAKARLEALKIEDSVAIDIN